MTAWSMDSDTKNLGEAVAGNIYLAGVGSSNGLTCFQSQLANILLACDDKMSHNESEGRGQVLAG